MSCIRTSLEPRHYVVIRRKEINDLTFPFITPLKTQNNIYHPAVCFYFIEIVKQRKNIGRGGKRKINVSSTEIFIMIQQVINNPLHPVRTCLPNEYHSIVLSAAPAIQALLYHEHIL